MIAYSFKNEKVIIHVNECDLDTLGSINNKNACIIPDAYMTVPLPIGFVAQYSNKIIPSVVEVNIEYGIIARDIPRRNIDFKDVNDFVNKYATDEMKDELGYIEQRFKVLSDNNCFIVAAISLKSL